MRIIDQRYGAGGAIPHHRTLAGIYQRVMSCVYEDFLENVWRKATRGRDQSSISIVQLDVKYFLFGRELVGS